MTDTDPTTSPVVPTAAAVGEQVPEPTASILAWVEVRTSSIEKEMGRLRLQMIFLFAFLVAALIAAAVRGQVNDNRIELQRYLLCTERAAAITAYNAHLTGDAFVFPLPDCGPDPRTD